jgi:CPA1 family monovalent cation:H+ antiporter
MFIGLELPMIIEGLKEVTLPTAIGYGLLVTAVLIVARILSAFAAVVTTLIARNFITVADATNPGIKGPFLIGWSGMRGVVSLAAALSIPVTLDDGTAFPQRDLILFITFIVILVTLLLQGLTLPYLIKKFNMPDPDQVMPDDAMYNKLRKELARRSLDYLDKNYSHTVDDEPVLKQIANKWQDAVTSNNDALMTDRCKEIYRDILNMQRDLLVDWNKQKNIDEEIVRKHLLYLDLEEEKLQLL